MPTYITLMKFTEQGSKDLKGAPRRMESAAKAWELMGGTLLGAYFVMGEYDYIAVTESPSGSRQSCRTMRPGCTGFFMGMAIFLLP